MKKDAMRAKAMKMVEPEVAKFAKGGFVTKKAPTVPAKATAAPKSQKNMNLGGPTDAPKVAPGRVAAMSYKKPIKKAMGGVAKVRKGC